MNLNPAVVAFIEARRLREIKFPLRTLLYLYIHARRADVYCNYMEGLKLLHEWLSPLDIPEIPQFKVPDVLNTYDFNELSYLLRIPHHIIYYTVFEVIYGSEAATTLLLKSGNISQLSQKIPAPEAR